MKAFGVYDHEHDIALPAILVVDAQGRVAWSYLAESVTDRPDEDALLAELDRLRAASR